MVLNVFSAVQIVVLLSLLVVLSVSQRFDWARATKNGALVLVVLAGLTNLFVFGLAHDNKESRFARLHLHDSYHYLISAKYFRELGYQQIYQCTVKAFSELREEGSGAPRIFAVRDLDNRYQSIAAESVDCTADFSPARWFSFKADLQGFFRSIQTSLPGSDCFSTMETILLLPGRFWLQHWCGRCPWNP